MWVNEKTTLSDPSFRDIAFIGQKTKTVLAADLRRSSADKMSDGTAR